MNIEWHDFVPPITLRASRKLKQVIRPSSLEQQSMWCRITDGRLAGRALFCNPHADRYQRRMLEGVYERYIFDIIDQLDLYNRVVYDIGGHIGYFTLYFAECVGPDGHVVTFEPQPSNMERIRRNLSRNPDLSQRTTLVEAAVSDSAGQVAFLESEEIERGGSALSHLDGSALVLPVEAYQHHHPITVQTVRLDDQVSAGIIPPPDLVKLDVESSENLALAGAMELMRRYQPLWLIEVHTIANMLYLSTLFQAQGHKIRLLHEDTAGRCHVLVIPPGNRILGETGDST